MPLAVVLKTKKEFDDWMRDHRPCECGHWSSQGIQWARGKNASYHVFFTLAKIEEYCPCGWSLTEDDLALGSGLCESCHTSTQN